MKSSVLFIITLIIVISISLSGTHSFAVEENSDYDETNDELYDDELYDDEFSDTDEIKNVKVKDSMESMNRAIFRFNDKVYRYAIKPTTKGYNTVIPERARVSVKKFFLNITSPGRLLNCPIPG